MAKIIEVTGPPGAGKTTILKALNKSWSENKKWIHYKKVLPHESLTIKKPFTLGLNLLYLSKYGKTRLNSDRLLKAGMLFIKDHRDYIETYWQSLSSKNICNINQDNRFKIANTFFEIVQVVQYINQLKSEKFVIIDEGLVHRLPVTNFNKNNEKNFSDLDELIEKTPLPNALIFIDADVETIIKRLQLRKKKIPMHKDLSSEELRVLTSRAKQRMNYVVDSLKAKNLPILLIDSNNTVDINIEKIDNFINELS